MIKSKAIDILKALSPEEFKEFGKFVRSPYFNENGKLVELYGLLKKYYPEFSNRNFSKENLYVKLFAGRAYNDGTMRKLLSGMQSVAEEYLTHSHFGGKNLFQRKLALLYQLDEKKLDRLFEINLNELNDVYKKLENFEDDYFKDNFELEVARINFDVGRGRGIKDERLLSDLLKCATYMICYCLITVLKLNQDLFATRISYDFDYRNTIAYSFIESLGPEKFISSIKKYAPEFYPVMAIYFNRFMIAAKLDEGDSYYWNLKELVMKNLEKFTRFEKYNLMLFLENSCAEKNYSGKDFTRELHNIHKMMLSTGLFVSQDLDYLPLLRFMNMIKNALLINEFVWTEEFISKYLNRLTKEFRNNMYHYAFALLNFRRGQFDEALENISMVKFEVYTMKFDAWALKLKSEFELNYYEEAFYSIDSYRHSLRNDTTSPEWMKARFSSFMNYFHKILKIKSDGEKVPDIEKEIFRDEISKSGELLEKEWLLEKLK